MKQLIYLVYYLKNLNTKLYADFLDFAKHKTNKSKFLLMLDSVASTLRYKISLLEYFQFKFYEQTSIERNNWAGTGFMYEYQLKMNPKNSRNLLEDKIKFLLYFRNFVKRSFIVVNPKEDKHKELTQLLNNTSGKLVLKNAMGQVGAEVEVVQCKNFKPESLIRFMIENKYNLAEEFVIQHPAIMELSPSGLNTVRIFTQLYEGKVDFLGARLRISVNSPVDNMAAGNLATPVNLESGIVEGPGVYSDITKNDEIYHPVTGKKIIGFQIPFWKETLVMATNAALNADGNLSVGWDIAITENGPELIEGNHNWCKLLWQLPVKKGLKPMIEKYL